VTKKWICLSSSTGETFINVFNGLDDTFKKDLLGFFTDRDCLAIENINNDLPALNMINFNKEEFEAKLLTWISENSFTGMIFLCGFYKILSADFIKKCNCIIINTHPSLLPSYPGMDKDVHNLAWLHSPMSGFTVHLVNEKIDNGPILFQQPVKVNSAWSVDQLRSEVRQMEQRLLPLFLSKILKSDLSTSDLSSNSIELRRKYKF